MYIVEVRDPGTLRYIAHKIEGKDAAYEFAAQMCECGHTVLQPVWLYNRKSRWVVYVTYASIGNKEYAVHSFLFATELAEASMRRGAEFVQIVEEHV